MLDVVFGQASDPGKIRTNNEDSVGAFVPHSQNQARSHGYLFALADGVSGSDLGGVASSIAVSVLMKEFQESPEGEMLISLLPRLVEYANAAASQRASAPESLGKAIATTVVACAIRHDQAVISQVGESRCYLVRRGMAKQITQDHTRADEPSDLIADRHPTHSAASDQLLRFSSTERFLYPETTALTIHPGDLLVLCSDGVHDKVAESTLAAIVSQSRPVDVIAHELVARAIESDGNDHATVLVIRIRSVEQVATYRGRPFQQSF